MQVKPLNAILYARNSRGGKSVKAQMIENRRECDERGWLIVGEFIDTNRSASRYAKKIREGFDVLVEQVRAGQGDVIVTWENSRLQRDLEVYVQIRRLCMETNTLWCYGGDVYDMSRRQDRKRTAQDAVASEDEVDVIRDRNLRTVRLNAESGRPHGRVLVGYSRRYDPETGELIDQVPNEEWAPVIQRIFAQFVSRRTVRSIRNGLRGDGIKTITGREWSDGGINAVLRRAAYAGFRVHQGEIIGRGTWDGLISEEVWQEAQDILDDPTRQSMGDTSVRYLLSGIASGSKCGGGVRVTPNSGTVSYICSEDGCVSLKLEVFDAYVEERLIRWLERPDAAAAFQDPGQETAVDDALRLISTLTAELDQARAAARNGQLTTASLIAIEAGSLPRLAEAQATVRAHSAASPLLAGLMGCPDAGDQWEKLAIEQKRAVLREVATIVLHPALSRGNSALYDGRIVMTLGPKRPGQSSDAASTAPSND
ncbi:recombinase family protein [Kitasatospora sp. NPDC127116]|uniref:recombinase family protein n=1 Tax=Kitasatospora sp. NPDC127116 TaxID=3345367 RepID=UPI00363D8A94